MGKGSELVEDPKIFDPQNRKELVRGWLLHAHKMRDRHNSAARRYEDNRLLIGVPATILSAIVGSSVFATLGEQPGQWQVLLVGLGAIASAILIALQTFLDYPARAASHHLAAAHFKELIHRIEEPAGDEAQLSPSWIKEIRERMDDIEAAGPVIGLRLFQKVEKKYTNPVLIETWFTQQPTPSTVTPPTR